MVSLARPTRSSTRSTLRCVNAPSSQWLDQVCMKSVAKVYSIKMPRFMAAFPSICRTQDGELLLVFRRAPDSRWLLNATFDAEVLAESSERALDEELYHWDAGSHLACLRFDQELVSQGEVCGLPVDGQSADQDASLLLLDNGDILLASFSWYAMPPAFADLVRAWGGKPYGGPKNTGCTYIPWGSYLRRTSDSGRSWDERQYLPPLPGDVDLVTRNTHVPWWRLSRTNDFPWPGIVLSELCSNRWNWPETQRSFVCLER